MNSRQMVPRGLSSSVDIDCYPSQEKELMQLLDRWADEGKSGSSLILGPRGAGKTTLLHRCLAKIHKRFTTVKLHGFLQSTDVAAVREMTRQLEGEAWDDSDDEETEVCVASTVKDLVTQVTSPLLVILEEFDRFAAQRAPEKQYLLYSLLDLTHNAPSPLLVIGISSNLDALDMLEKRVRSRICQKPLLLSNQWSFEAYLEYAKAMLLANVDQDENGWKKAVQAAVSNEQVISCLRRQYEANRSLQRLRQYLKTVVALLKEKDTLSAGFGKASDLLAVNSRQVLLQSLSVFELSLVLIAAYCMRTYGHSDELNFEIIYKEYSRLARANGGSVDNAPFYPKSVALQVFDGLCQLGAFAMSKTMKWKSNMLRQYAPIKLQIDTDTIRDYIKKGEYPSFMNEWLQFQ